MSTLYRRRKQKSDNEASMLPSLLVSDSVNRSWGFALAAILASVAVGALTASASASRESTIGIAAVMMCLGFAAAGRRDLTRPGITLPIVWYAAVGAAQLRLLTGYQTYWSGTTIFLVFGGPIAFVIGSALVGFGGTRPKRRSLDLKTLAVPRLRKCAIVLLTLGILGLYWKSRIQGGTALFSSNIDALRSAGGVKIHAWITMLTDCTYISSWIWALAAFRSRGRRRLYYGIFCAIGLVGAGLGASRNTLLLTILVPLIVVYIARSIPALRLSVAIGLGTLLAIILLISSGLFFLRINQHQGAAFETYFNREVVPTVTPVLRPVLPIYVGLAAPFETLNRVVVRFSASSTAHAGVYSIPGIPPQLDPFGARGDFYEVTGALSRPYYFNVATYEGPLFADGGVWLVLMVSFILGLCLSLIRRHLLQKPTFASMWCAAYITYLVIILVYENVLAFYTLSVISDIVILVCVLRYCQTGSHVDAGPSPNPAPAGTARQALLTP